jgi:hypothetical protein
MESSLRAHIRWFFRALSPARNSLRRRVDRVESALVALVMLLALLVVPLSAAVGGVVYGQGARAAERAAMSIRHVPAVLQEDGPSAIPNPDGKTDGGTQASATWTGVDGRPHSGLVPVALGTRSGTTVQVWVDTADRVVSPPPTSGQVIGSAVIVACATLLGAEFVCAMALLGLRAAAIRSTSRAWQHEWEIVEPQWRRMQL